MGFRYVKVIAEEAYAVVVVEKEENAELKTRKFLQHTGVRISSRQAEDLLAEVGKLDSHRTSLKPSSAFKIV